MTTTTSTRKARTPLSDADKAARDAEAQELHEATDAALSDPDTAEAAVDLAIVSPSLTTKSLRNIIMLMTQAMVRGIELTDVDTYKGWQARGRQVRRGEHALKMVVPISDRKNDDQAADVPREAIITPKDQADAPPRKFRIMGRWFDISQTDANPDHDPDTEPDDEGDAFTEIFQSLTTQAQRAGYTVTVRPDTEPHAEAVERDDAAATIRVYTSKIGAPGDDVPAMRRLGRHVATVTAAAQSERHAAKTPTAPAPTPGVVTLTED